MTDVDLYDQAYLPTESLLLEGLDRLDVLEYRKDLLLRVRTYL